MHRYKLRDAPVQAAATTGGEACAHPPDLPAGITESDYYSGPAPSVIDPARFRAYRKAVAPLQHVAQYVVAMADRYRTDGDVAAADSQPIGATCSTGALRSFEIGADQITADGTLPLEMVRRSRALHYHLFAAAPLVAMSELAAANGVDLYNRNDEGLARLVDRAVVGIVAPDWFSARAGVPQEPVKLDAR